MEIVKNLPIPAAKRPGRPAGEILKWGDLRIGDAYVFDSTKAYKSGRSSAVYHAKKNAGYAITGRDLGGGKYGIWRVA